MGSRARRGNPVWRARAAATMVGPVCVLLAGCSDGGSPDRPPDQSAVALQIRIVSGARGIDDRERAEAEQEIGDVLSAYVVSGFLGDYPREDFVQSFDSFTNGAARSAARDIDLLTAARFGDASTVTARRLTAAISCLAKDGNVVGATARVTLAFEASGLAGGTRTIKLSGRFMLVKDHATWNVFGYDVARADAPGTGQTS